MNVQTIPADFYGGLNPVIKFKKVEKEIDLGAAPKLSFGEKKMLDKATAAGSGKVLHPANILTSRKGLIIIAISLFLIFAGGAGIYYWLQLRSQQAPPPAVVPITPPENTPVAPVETPPVEVPTTTPTTTEVTPPLGEAPIDFPSILLGDSVDMDKDGLTDVEEDLYKTDPANPDTDGDGYSDGHEVFYLYSPIGKEPAKLVDSGIVKNYTNPAYGFSIYYPVAWAFGNVDPNYKDILLSTITGENVEVREIDKDPTQSFADWFAVWAPDQKYGDLVDFESRFGEKGMMRSDSLVYYFSDNTHVYVILFHTTDSNVVNYRSTIKMIARSFRFAGNNTEVPEQSIETNLTPEINGSAATATPEVPVIPPTTTAAETATGTAATDTNQNI